MIGTQLVIEPLDGMSQISSDPQPHCQIITSTPNDAPTEMMFSRIAFSGSRIERKARTSRKKVTTEMTRIINGSWL